MGEGHPEQPARLSAIFDRLIASGLEMIVRQIDAPLATREQLERVHEPRYVQAVFDRAPADGLVMLDPDTAMGPHTLAAALRSAGAVVHAVDLVMNREFQAVFCAVRPPGHHAERDRAMGFCFFNNVAVGIRHATQVLGLERVALIDFDVHHGNGSEEILAGDEQVLMVSTFQTRLYPFNGEEARGPNMCNVGLPPYSDGAALRAAVSERWLPALRDFRPQMLFISAGFDAHREDDMSQLGWRDEDYAWVSREIVRFADEACDGRIVSTLEGGYHIAALARCVELHLRALLGLD